MTLLDFVNILICVSSRDGLWLHNCLTQANPVIRPLSGPLSSLNSYLDYPRDWRISKLLSKILQIVVFCFQSPDSITSHLPQLFHQILPQAFFHV
jgi:hypothetical protein